MRVLAVTAALLAGTFAAQADGLAGRIVFVGRKQGEGRQLFSVRPDGTGLRQMSTSASDKRRPAVSAADGRVAFSTNRGELRLLDPRSGAETVLESGVPGVMWDSPAWSPDGKTLIAVRQLTVPTEDSDLHVLLPPPARCLLPMPGMEYDPAFSPDGKQIVYARFGERKSGVVQETLWVLDLATRAARAVLSNGADNHQPCWPGPSKVLYAGNAAGSIDIWSLDLASGQVTRLTSSADFEGEPCGSPDGSGAVWVTAHGSRTMLSVLAAGQSSPRRLELPLQDAREPAWTRDLPP